MTGSPGVLLLAAGRAARFGSDKRLARLSGGQCLLNTCIATVCAADLPLRVALRSGDDALAEDLEARSIATLRCADAPRGMGATLAEAVRQLPPWEAVLVALADMPWLRADSVRAVAAAAGEGCICIPSFRGRRGHPVAFGARFLPDLARLDGDNGARELTVRHARAVRELALDDPGIVRDVDRPGDLTVSG